MVERFMSKCLLGSVIAGLAASMLLGAGCAGSKNDEQGDAEGAIVVVRGKISSQGSTPFALLVLEGSDGKSYAIENSHLADELRSLDGMEVTVRGSVLPRSAEHVTIDVISYEILALPSGEIPIVGYIRTGGLIEDSSLVMWMIEGDFADLLRNFVGAKVWVVGVTRETVETPEARYHVILVTEYGVIRP
jgi:chloramphenicol 3-O-phosphotransferase